MTPSSPLEAGTMAGHGFYADHSQPQHEAAAMGLDLLREAAARLPLHDDGRPLIVADLGAAAGRNSLVPVQTVKDALAARTPADVMVVHTDLPGNDWATFFTVMAEHDPPGPVGEAPGHGYSYAAGRSFYDRVLPADSLSLAWTASTLHWLSRAPGGIDGHFFVQSSHDRGARQRYRAQSVRDWERFLACRASELRVGGAVVFVDTLMGDDGTMGAGGLFDALQAAIAAQHAAGTISDAGLRALAYPSWFRTLAELRAPFADGGGGFSGPGGVRLELDALEALVLDDPFAGLLDGTAAGAAAYAAGQVGFLRGFLEPSFIAQLAGTESDPDALAGVWAVLQRQVARDPGGLAPSWRMVAGRAVRAR